MTASTLPARVLGALVVAAALVSPATPEAQRRQVLTPPEGTSRFMVPTLRSTERGMGVQGADAIRSRLRQDFATRDLWVISKENICALLEASGFNCDNAPERVTAKLLAQQLRADEYLEGSINKGGDGFVLTANMVLTRNNNLVQPIGTFTGARMLDVATAFSREFKEARRQLEANQACENAIRDGNLGQARQHARAAIEAYPKATLGRLCMINALVEDSASADSILALSQEVLQIDSNSRLALLYSARAHALAQDTTRAVETYTKLISLDPTNIALQTEVVNYLAAAGNARSAIPIIEAAVEANPGDPDLLRLRFLIYLTVREWKQAIASGEDLLATDTAATDTLFFQRLAIAYATDSQPQKAAEITARSVAKYADNAGLWSLHARMLKNAGQLQPSAEAARRALSISPNNSAGWLALADVLVEMQQPDSAVAALRSAIQYSDTTSKAQIAQRLLIIGNQSYRAGNDSKNREDFLRAVRILSVADTVAQEQSVKTAMGQTYPQLKFVLGVSAFQVAASAAQENQEAKRCELAQMAQQHLLIAQLNIPVGGAIAPQQAGQILQSAQQFQPAVEGQVARDCR
ncbi:MAG TPA: tetratricopeptide repeat protein [Gemmatimonadaceae bacterium]|nr:tetratricopeptide repeat protein [Gemmatimonadaceae bacterium]